MTRVHEMVFKYRRTMMDEKQESAPATQSVEELQAILHASYRLMRTPQQLCLFFNTPKSDTVVSVQEGNPNHTTAMNGFQLWHCVYDEKMSKSYSKIRNHDANFLVISIVDAVVNEIMPIIHIFEVKVAVLESLQALDAIKFDTRHVSHTKYQLGKVQKIVRPLLEMVENHLVEEEAFQTVRRRRIQRLEESILFYLYIYIYILVSRHRV